MAGILFNIFFFVRARLFSTQVIKPTHPWGIPLPPNLHQTLDKAFTDRFDEILILGDVHGCFDEMYDCLKSVHQNTDSKILKIFVGDLVNKGEKSREVIKYLMNEGKDDCLAVRGNHDEHVIREFFKIKENAAPLPSFPSLKWVKELTQEEVDYLIKLPYTLKLSALDIIIVHAGLVPGLPLKSNQLFDMVSMRNIVQEDPFDGSGLKPTASDKEGEPWACLWPGPEHIYFGHDAKRGLQRQHHATGLDTGCVYGKHLTAVFVKGPRKGTFISVKAKRVYQPISEK